MLMAPEPAAGEYPGATNEAINKTVKMTVVLFNSQHLQ